MKPRSSCKPVLIHSANVYSINILRIRAKVIQAAKESGLPGHSYLRRAAVKALSGRHRRG